MSNFYDPYRTAPLKENRKSKKKFLEKRGPQCLLSLSVCVCVKVSAACRPQFLTLGADFWHERSLGEPFETHFFCFLKF